MFNVLLLKINLDAVVLQLSHRGKAVHRIAGESAHALGDNKVDLSGEGVSYHLLKALAPLGIRYGDSFVYVNAAFDTIRFCLCTF